MIKPMAARSCCTPSSTARTTRSVKYLAAVNTGRTLMVGLRNLNEVDASQSELRHRLATERRAMERLLFSPHRNVVHVLFVEHGPERILYGMEPITGDLQTLVAVDGPQTVPVVRKIVRQIVRPRTYTRQFHTPEYPA